MEPISIIIVTWNCESFIERFLGELSISLQQVDEFEVLILDNASSDQTLRVLQSYCSNSRFSVISSIENLGFAAGNNLLLKRARYQNIILLNPDVFSYPVNFWKDILNNTSSNSADVAFVRLNNPDGSFQDCIGEFPSFLRGFKRLLGFHPKFSDIQSPCRVDVGIMAFMLTKKQVFERIGLIDQDFHMYSEDIEWCYRARKANLKVMYFPSLCLTHVGGASSKQRWSRSSKRLVNLDSELLFFRKHYTGINYLSSVLLTYAKIAIIKAKLKLGGFSLFLSTRSH